MTEKLPRYLGARFPDPDLHDGRIPPAFGVKCYQIARANASDPNLDDGTTNTYKHAADMAYFDGRFYVQYLSNPFSEHTGAGECVLASSADCMHWDKKQISFGKYKIPACEIVDYKGVTHTFTGEEYGFYHQRMAFFYSKQTDRMLVLAFVGYSAVPWQTPWNDKGIGRLVREIKKDGTLGEIYFIGPNFHAGWTDELLNYPMYHKSEDAGFVAACEELLSNRLFVQQWAEENGDIDPIIAIKHPPRGSYQAFWWYHLPGEKELVGIWKHALYAYSNDGGVTFTTPKKVPSMVMSGQKSFIRSTADGKYACVYDPTLDTQHRYPLCVTTSENGLDFDDMHLICGRVPPMRHGGFWKDFGLQYMRGILEDLPQPKDDYLHLVYSSNKEDIWNAFLPTPVRGGYETQFTEDFEQDADRAFERVNVYCPSFAKVEKSEGGLYIADAEPYDSAEVAKVFAPTAHPKLSVSLTPMQKDSHLVIEACTEEGIVAARLLLLEDGMLYHRVTCNWEDCGYEASKRLDIEWDLDCENFTYTLTVNSEPILRPGTKDVKDFLFMTAVPKIGYLRIRTGDVDNHNPTPDTLPHEEEEYHLPDADLPAKEKAYLLHRIALKE